MYEMDEVVTSLQAVSKYLLNENKASGGCHGFSKEWIVRAQFKIRTHWLSVAKAKRQQQLRQGEIDWRKCE